MSAQARSFFVRVLALVGLAASGLLLVDYVASAPTFCSEAGCAVVRSSRYAHPAGVPMPVLGILGFGAIMLLSFTRARRLLLAIVALGALSGLGFMALQAFAIGAFCTFCLVADAAALVLAAVCFAPPRPRMAAGKWPVWISLALLVLAAPWAWSRLEREPALALPDVIAVEQQAGVVTIVEFFDLECPVCRELHGILKPLAAEYGDRVRIVRKHWPLPRHEHALGAAAAVLCAEDQGKGEEMVDALFLSDDLSETSRDKIAEALGLDRAHYKDCLGAERTAARIKTDIAAAKLLELRGIPSFWIGHQKFEGAQPAPVLRASIERALGKSR